MNQVTQKNKNIAFNSLTISGLFVLFSFIWQGDKGFSLLDEGFLWYGVQRVLLGEVPIRDFMAYDPGRYYWSAALLSFIGDNGIMGLRSAVAVFQALGLFVGLLLIAMSEKNETRYSALFLTISAATLALWMFPRHKLFDISISIFLLGTLTYLISSPIPKRYFISGVCVGLIAFFGRNHGIYGTAASLGVIAWLNIKSPTNFSFTRGILLWVMGVTIGFLPIIFMVLVIPGFAGSFLDSILFLIEQKATNLPLPVPWPWAVSFSSASISDIAQQLLLGIFFVGILLFGILSVIWVVHQRWKQKPASSVLVASAFLSFPYAHYAFSRADVGHLAQGIFPALIGCLVILSGANSRIKWPFAVVLFSASFWIMHIFHPGWQCLETSQCISIKVANSELKLDKQTASDIALLHQLAMQYAPDDQSFIATPFWPGAYALLERKSPMWEIYALFSRPESFEKKEIERIKVSNPRFAFIFDFPLDGRNELRFKNTHPLIYQYIIDNFDPVSISQNPAYQIYKARGVEQ